jgi:hypothetical protein
MAPGSTTLAATDEESRRQEQRHDQDRPQNDASEDPDAGTKREFGVSASDRYFPLSTATMQTSVFDVVHIFSERGISAVPILDKDGVVLNMYETVDIVVSYKWIDSETVPWLITLLSTHSAVAAPF